jgi:hypothetical protein
MHVLLFLEQFDEQLVEANHDVPVDEPQIVAFDVRFVVDELAGRAAAFRPAFAFHAAGQHLAGGDFQPFEPSEKLGR